jgi:hypothetical protein
MIYPATARGDVIDDYFGTKVSDPYCRLDDLDSPEVETGRDFSDDVTWMRFSDLSRTGDRKASSTRGGPPTFVADAV